MLSMKCSVITLRDRGRRLRKAEWQLARLGCLVSDPKTVDRADLWADLDNTSRRTVLSLLRPTFAGVVSDGFLLAGHELHLETVDGIPQQSEHRQLWMVTPLSEI